MQEIYWNQGDTEPLLLKATDANGKALDLTGATGKFNMRKISNGTQKVSNGDVVITAPLTGEYNYPWAETDVDMAGESADKVSYYIQIVFTRNLKKLRTYRYTLIMSKNIG